MKGLCGHGIRVSRREHSNSLAQNFSFETGGQPKLLLAQQIVRFCSLVPVFRIPLTGGYIPGDDCQYNNLAVFFYSLGETYVDD